VTEQAFVSAAFVSYGLAMVAYAAFAVRVLAGLRRSLAAVLLVATLVATALWAGAAILVARKAAAPALLLLDGFDLARYALWLAFLAVLMRGAPAHDAQPSPWPRGKATMVGLGLIACLALSDGLPLSAALGATGPRLELALRLGLSVIGLVAVEQLMRRSHPQFRWSLRPLAVGLAGIFAYDLFLYSDAMLFTRLDLDFWIARGVAHALVIPFIALSTARNTGWSVELHISRKAVFHSTALVVSAGFLLAVAAAGYLVRYFGGAWGPALQVELLFAALLCVVLVATSGSFRSRVRVFVSKHFFSYRYDYREEWLRFTRTLAEEGGAQRLSERVVMALADLVESPGGALWLRDEHGRFVPAARFNVLSQEAVEPDDGSLVPFLEQSGWIVDLAEYRANRAAYVGLVLPAWLEAMPAAWLVVPLPAPAELTGFVVLTTARTTVDVDWEVRDVLKTASRQAASFLAQARATEALLEARKFDAFNRMSAFVVHDLKNLVSQLSLVLRNAERHRDNPEFQRDMLDTVHNVVERMNRLMLQLRATGTPVVKPHAVDLVPLVRRICAAKSDATRVVQPLVEGEVSVIGHAERLEHVLGHLVQNAVDASAPGQAVAVRVAQGADGVVVEVVDRGTGMSDQYVREHLGKPFETTKPSGMGIGVYESMQYLASIGGRLAVETSPGKGSTVRVFLPPAETTHVSPNPQPA
jgi:putative PEP-CTERM system histidine kinase